MAKKVKPYVYDIYILTTSGLPLFGGCTGSEFCQHHTDQHTLHCGFFAAMKSFCEEAFAQPQIRLIEMDNLRIHMLAEPSAKVIFAGVYPMAMQKRTSNKQLVSMTNRFMKKYEGILTTDIVNDKFFRDFTEDLLALKIIPSSNLRQSLAAQFEDGTKKVHMPSLPRC